MLPCASNGTFSNISSDYIPLDAGFADLYILTTGSIIYFGVFPFLILQSRCVPLGSTIAVLLGALMLVLFQVVKQEEVYTVMSQKENVNFIMIMCGVTVFAHLIDRQHFINSALKKLLRAHYSFEKYLFLLCLFVFMGTVLVSNDAIIKISTPVFLRLWDNHERNRQEINVLLIGICTTANIASVASVFGSPAIVLLVSKTSLPEYANSRLDIRSCIMYLLPTSVVVFFLNYGLLVMFYHIRHKYSKRTILVGEPSSQQEMAGLTSSVFANKHNGNGSVPIPIDDQVDRPSQSNNQLETIMEDEVLVIQNSPSLNDHRLRYADDSDSSSDSDDGGINSISSPQVFKNRAFDNRLCNGSPSLRRSNNISINMNLHLTGSNYDLDAVLKTGGLRIYRRLGVYRSLSALSFVQLLKDDNQKEDDVCEPEVSSKKPAIVYDVCLLLVYAALIACLMASSFGVNIDTGLTVTAAVTIMLSADAIFNRRCCSGVLRNLDWSVIILWLAVFVWMHGLSVTRLPQTLWHMAGMATSDFSTISHIAILTAFITLPSAVVGNVAMVMISLNFLVPCVNQLPLVLLTSWLAAVAGNMTLYSSVSNIITAYEGTHHQNRHKLTSVAFLQFGFPSTVINVIMGVFIISGLLRIH